MKKIIIVTLIVLCKSLTTNAQDVNSLTSENSAAKNLISENNNDPAVHLSLFTKNELLKFNNPGNPGEKTDYLQKSRNNRIASLCLVGGGLVIAGIGALSFPKDYDIVFENSSDKENKADVSTALIVVGCAAMLSSIPFTVMSSVNKRKANAMVGSQKTGSGILPPGVGKNITGITMTISIGK